jgi:hypothetical protein
MSPDKLQFKAAAILTTPTKFGVVRPVSIIEMLERPTLAARASASCDIATATLSEAIAFPSAAATFGSVDCDPDGRPRRTTFLLTAMPVASADDIFKTTFK